MDKKKIMIIFVCVYIVLFTFLSIHRHNIYRSSWDLGVSEQIFWNIHEGRFFYSDEFRINYLGNHSNIFYIFIIPLYHLFPETFTLLFLQSLAIGFSGWIIFNFGNIFFKKTLIPFILGLMFLINPILWHVNLEDFHPIIFAIPIFLATIYFMEKENWSWYWFFLITLLLVQENVSLVIVFLGVYIFLFKNKSVGIKTFSIGIIWFLLIINIVSPILNTGAYTSESEGKYLYYTMRYSYLGNNVFEIIHTIITKPLYVLTYNSIFNKAYVFSFFFLMLLLLPFGSFFTIISIPIFLQNLLTTDGTQICPIIHHSALLVPILFVSSILTLKKIKNKKILDKILLFFILVSIFFSITIGIVPLFADYSTSNNLFMNGMPCFKNEFNFADKSLSVSQKYYREVNKEISKIPSSSSVIANQHVFPHLIKTKSAVTGQFGYHEGRDYVIIDNSDVWNEFADEFLMNYETEGYKLIFERNETVFIFKRIS